VVTLDSTTPFSAARARNEGFAALKVLKPDIRFVQFIDGDCILVQTWLNKALTFFERRTDVGIACGRRREQYPTASIYNQLCDFEWDTPLGEASACGGDALVRVEAFETVGGFRSQLMAGARTPPFWGVRKIFWKGLGLCGAAARPIGTAKEGPS